MRWLSLHNDMDEYLCYVNESEAAFANKSSDIQLDLAGANLSIPIKEGHSVRVETQRSRESFFLPKLVRKAQNSFLLGDLFLDAKLIEFGPDSNRKESCEILQARHSSDRAGMRAFRKLGQRLKSMRYYPRSIGSRRLILENRFESPVNVTLEPWLEQWKLAKGDQLYFVDNRREEDHNFIEIHFFGWDNLIIYEFWPRAWVYKRGELVTAASHEVELPVPKRPVL